MVDLDFSRTTGVLGKSWKGVPMSKAYFTKDFFEFWTDLRANNNREWFAANKSRYENDVREPALRFITDMAQPLRKISRHLVADARPTGGSMFRIHRDTRFS